MTEFDFDIIVDVDLGQDDSFDERFCDLVDALYEAGCSDATISSSNGSLILSFDREALTLEQAIDSAKADIAKVKAVKFRDIALLLSSI